jgi:predicted O-methyltransferase YrrM
MIERAIRLRRELGERRLELKRAPFSRAALTALGIASAGALLRRPREGVLAGLAGAAAVRSNAAEGAGLERLLRNDEDLAAIGPRLGPRLGALGNWAVDADFARLALGAAEARTGLAVELGSGTSTLLIASLIAERGRGRLVSFDHDAGFAAESAARVRQLGTEAAQVVVAPLRRQQFGATEVDWYERETLLGALPEEPIELLVVDGPPMQTTWSRWPALEVLGPRLAPNAIVLLDDGRRRPERASAFRWERDFPQLKLCWHDTLKGAWRLEPGPVEESTARRLGRRVLRLLNPNPTGFGRWPVQR